MDTEWKSVADMDLAGVDEKEAIVGPKDILFSRDCSMYDVHLKR